jgi:hypothetical protein
MSDYTEYYANRKPAKFSWGLIRFWHTRMLTIASKFIPELASKTILEVGAGHGFFATACQIKQIAYHGLEMNVEQASLLRAHGHNIIPARIPPIPSGEPVQVVWLSHVLEHAATYVEAKQMLLACHDRLDAGGYVVIIAPDLYHWKEEFWSLDWSHGFPTTLVRVEQLLNETGFSIRQSMHHTFTITNACGAWIVSMLFRCFLPRKLLDYFFHKMVGRRFCNAFMSVFGLRQIYLIGKKR